VIFTLCEFNTLAREGVELTSGFTDIRASISLLETAHDFGGSGLVVLGQG
jgi:hypothetical protein